MSRICPGCSNEMPISRTTCPHCGRPQFFPNVDLAETPDEREKLRAKYDAVMMNSTLRHVDDIVRSFERACESSVAVFACPILKLHRAIASSTDIFETYYDLERLKLRADTPAGVSFDWARLRPQAEIELLGDHHNIDKLHYACLSLNGDGLESYGDCIVQLATEMIAHRASCFEGNTAVLFKKHHNFSGFVRSGWSERHKLSVAVFEECLNPGCKAEDFSRILVQIKGDPVLDRFVEVHIFGPMTARTFGTVRVNVSKHRKRDRLLLKAIREKHANLPIEEFGS